MNPDEISPAQFKSLCEQFLTMASDYLTEMDSRSIPPKVSGAEIERIFGAALPEIGLADEALRAFSDVVQHSRVQNGRFFGYVLLVPERRQAQQAIYSAASSIKIKQSLPGVLLPRR